ncbi:hypothetical protein HA402_006664 [Bradysia odoriphaga]|nr:hypothetical protein HA402_006664 [Bradysia odoriphaga]
MEKSNSYNQVYGFGMDRGGSHLLPKEFKCSGHGSCDDDPRQSDTNLSSGCFSSLLDCVTMDGIKLNSSKTKGIDTDDDSGDDAKDDFE